MQLYQDLGIVWVKDSGIRFTPAPVLGRQCAQCVTTKWSFWLESQIYKRSWPENKRRYLLEKYQVLLLTRQ